MKKYFIWMKGAAALCTMLSIICLSVSVFGYTHIDTDRKTSLTLTFSTEKTALSGTEFSLYHVAEVSASIDYTLKEAFAETGVSFQGLKGEEWQAMSKTLAEYVDSGKVEPVKSQSTDSKGRLIFSDLKEGLYLVTGKACDTGKEIYTPIPFLINLPNLDPETDEWEYDANAIIKYEVKSVPEPNLPQTGQLWLPVYALGAFGIAIVMSGFIKGRKQNKRHES